MSTFTVRHAPSLKSQHKKDIPAGWLRSIREAQLTVLCYHRVEHPDDNGFQGFKPTYSATREAFVRQMDYLKAHYNPISLRDLVAWLDEDRQLPPCPVLITFDDGYRDNAEVAWPIMRDRGLPAAIFLATEYIGAGRPFIWDFAAYCFQQTPRYSAAVPLIGWTSLGTEGERDSATVAWVEKRKRLPAAGRDQAMSELAAALDVPPAPQDTFRRLYLDWSDVQVLARQGVEFGAHTCSHPILTQVSPTEADEEIIHSINELTSRLGAAPLAFAYPNGSARDYSHVHEAIVRQSGMPVAFSLEPGPIALPMIRNRLMSIPRIYIGRNDNMLRFIAKLNGVARFSHLVRSYLPLRKPVSA
ncbi:polysaccharide deacetylase family protein [Microvirga splendida]|uniref:Chitooligosaccharide deacetylase n=1 Tax=Microvirga splendida TaxID=2795727 RepID=A0ABS0Y1I9_9HYPH|nr:polysaccharide deacetylase family protein [Microvirga splendida]MBJ6126167.1 polysaccharide deacetylase family protein [Microvirga splendida]